MPFVVLACEGIGGAWVSNTRDGAFITAHRD
jgi:hypothetical protein